ncbi:MAG: hypothetical protein OEZ34_04900 [Spirochaetia bacterium]|nr:hypothetical protein [Spirochaetia bacterium]
MTASFFIPTVSVKRLCAFFILLVFTLPAFSCSFINTRKEVKYRVNNSEGYLIIAEHGQSIAVGTESAKNALDCEIKVSDENGYFTLNRYSWFLIGKHYTWIYILRPGYREHKGYINFWTQSRYFSEIHFELPEESDTFHTKYLKKDYYKKKKKEIRSINGTCGGIIHKLSNKEYQLFQKYLEENIK